jgi:hypothetical protein
MQSLKHAIDRTSERDPFLHCIIADVRCALQVYGTDIMFTVSCRNTRPTFGSGRTIKVSGSDPCHGPIPDFCLNAEAEALLEVITRETGRNQAGRQHCLTSYSGIVTQGSVNYHSLCAYSHCGGEIIQRRLTPSCVVEPVLAKPQSS